MRELPVPEPDAFETWLTALAPLERSAFDERVEALLRGRGEAGAPRGLARWLMAARELYEEQQQADGSISTARRHGCPPASTKGT